MQGNSGILRERTVNPAKVYMRGYLELSRQVEALLDRIDAIHDQSTRATSRLTATRVSGTRMRDGVANAALETMDCVDQLRTRVCHIREAMAVRLALIDQLSDERYKTVCIMRYLNGWGWDRIAGVMGYNLTDKYIFRLHGKALSEISRMMTQTEHFSTPKPMV